MRASVSVSLPEKLGTLQYDGVHEYEDPLLGISVSYQGRGQILTIYFYNLGLEGIQVREQVDAQLFEIRHLINECRTPKLFTSTNQSNIPMQRLLATLEFARSGFIENLDEGDPEVVYFKRLRDNST